MAYWLIKSEPEAFSWAQQMANGTEPWTGVRNHQAKKNLATMEIGDRAFFYHSVSEKRIVGVVEVVRVAYPDPTAPEGSAWVCTDMRAVGAMPRPVALAEIKATPDLQDIALVRQSRLSVVPLTPTQWDRLCVMGEWVDS
ncbi:EVE domain-containing protein [Brytella acorum]|uniref:EVE domain-containing protein n=1 Tax=Brytella acorum TaxID=2959299 RepID=A0AA35VCE8_9PROT|nr:EVE domain-containing protein [Brytella acorum]MDF3623530.1 EVE domain-containing protein [Brytella acorum]CAI9121615.1 EVE domain-containing protein [Brytella acorum]